jgi:hypothetical protein
MQCLSAWLHRGAPLIRISAIVGWELAPELCYQFAYWYQFAPLSWPESARESRPAMRRYASRKLARCRARTPRPCTQPSDAVMQCAVRADFLNPARLLPACLPVCAARAQGAVTPRNQAARPVRQPRRAAALPPLRPTHPGQAYAHGGASYIMPAHACAP